MRNNPSLCELQILQLREILQNFDPRNFHELVN